MCRKHKRKNHGGKRRFTAHRETHTLTVMAISWLSNCFACLICAKHSIDTNAIRLKKHFFGDLCTVVVCVLINCMQWCIYLVYHFIFKVFATTLPVRARSLPHPLAKIHARTHFLVHDHYFCLSVVCFAATSIGLQTFDRCYWNNRPNKKVIVYIMRGRTRVLHILLSTMCAQNS